MARAWRDAHLIGSGKELAPKNARMRLALLRRERIHNTLLYSDNLSNVALYNNLMESYVTGV